MTHDFRHRKDYQEYTQTQVLSRRISLLAVLTSLVLGFYLISLWYLQVVEGARYAALAEQNRIRRVKVRAPRGAILDRHGEILARNRISFSIHANGENLRDLDETFSALSHLLGTGMGEIRARFSHADARLSREGPVPVAEDVPLGAVAWVEAHRAELPGLTIEVDNLRHYEGGATGAHLLGYVGEVSSAELDSVGTEGASSGDIVGKAGLERLHDGELRGRNGYRQVIVNYVGREVGRLAGGVSARPGHNVRTSVDFDLQRAVDLAFGSERGAAVFMDPWTGEVLALSSRPGFDPNLFAKRFTRTLWRSLVADPRHPLQNRAIQSGYSPGSTFKLIEAVAALEEGIITPYTRFYCSGDASFHGRRFHCNKREGHGSVDLRTAIIKSCNIYFYNVADRLGIDRITEYAARFGLGSRSGIPMDAESPGLIPDADWRRGTGRTWYPSETISVGIGQGPLLVTPLQQAILASALATDGRRPIPTFALVPESEADHNLPGIGGRTGPPMDPAHLAVVRDAMWGVVHDGGTGGRALMEGFDVCGKTGTAQVVAASANVKHKEELPPELRDHSWFIGFAPLENPQVAFGIIVENGGHGSEAAAPLARRALEAFFSHRPPRPSTGPRPDRKVARNDSAGDPRIF